MIISFAWTKEPFIAGKKNVTRRYWNSDYAKRFKKDMIVKAYDRLPYRGGKQIGSIRVLKDPYQQRTCMMTDKDFVREGFSYMKKKNILIHGRDPRVVFDEWRLADDIVWVLEFEKLDGV